MNYVKFLFFQILFFSISVKTFIFFPAQKMNDNFFWHYKIINSTNSSFQFENHGKSVRVAMLDTIFHDSSEIQDFYQQKYFRLANFFKNESNLSAELGQLFFDETIDESQKSFSGLKISGQFLNKISKKNHGACVASLIRQFAPTAELISIPIFNDQGTTSIQYLLQGLHKALDQKVDILYIGLKIQDCNISDMQKKQILQLLQQFLYVIAPSGNDGITSSDIAFPANSIFFSVGAFAQKNNQYLICDFSQKEILNGPNFVMPGEELGCFIWDNKHQKMVPCLVSGTSMAAACMVGCLAIILSEYKQDFTPQQIQYLLQKNSQKLNSVAWEGKVNFGMINIAQCQFCLQQLQAFKNQMTQKKFNQKFEKIMDKLVKNFESE